MEDKIGAKEGYKPLIIKKYGLQKFCKKTYRPSTN